MSFAPQVRSTSLEIYRKIKENGFLTKLEAEVYDCFYEHGAMTTNEMLRNIAQVLGTANYRKIASYQKVVKRLVHRLALMEMGKRECTVTGNSANYFITTDRLPIKFEKPERHKCNACDGRGFIEETQARLF